MPRISPPYSFGMKPLDELMQGRFNAVTKIPTSCAVEDLLADAPINLQLRLLVFRLRQKSPFSICLLCMSLN